jgi:hypothetical protein
MKNSQRRFKTALLGLGFLFFTAGTALLVRADHIPTALDLPGFRTSMPNEGYLAHTVNPAAGRFGEEWTGWVDVRHPSLLGVTDTDFGYDRSDRHFDVRSNILTDSASITANASRARDFDYANKAYMLQSGVSIIETDSRNVTSGAGGAPVFSFGLSFNEEKAIMPAMNAAAPTVENYYAGTNGAFNSLDSNAFGETYNPSLIAGPANNEGVFMAERPVPRNDTFSHEMYHFVGDGLAVRDPVGGDAAHSNDTHNLIGSGGSRLIPASTSEIGPRMSATVGGKDQLISDQVDRMFNNAGAAPWLQKFDNGGAAGDHVDWDFTVDHNQFANDHDNDGLTPSLNFGVEGINGADNHPGVESMYWGIQPTIASSQVGKVKTGMGVFPATPDFGGNSFRTADVFSLGLRYSDSDINDLGTLSQREEGLDYNLFFRLADGSFIPGIPTAVFVGGWTGTSFADNYLARWLSPVDAIGVFIFALNDLGNDGVAQIDAVIVSAVAVPEPSAVLLCVAGLLLMSGKRNRQRCRAGNGLG